MKETPIQRAVVARLRKAVGGKWEITSPSAYTNSGRPDINGCVEGLTIKVEAKQPNKKPRNDQIAELAAWRQVGAVTAVIDDAHGAAIDELIEEILDRTAVHLRR